VSDIKTFVGSQIKKIKKYRDYIKKKNKKYARTKKYGRTIKRIEYNDDVIASGSRIHALVVTLAHNASLGPTFNNYSTPCVERKTSKSSRPCPLQRLIMTTGLTFAIKTCTRDNVASRYENVKRYSKRARTNPLWTQACRIILSAIKFVGFPILWKIRRNEQNNIYVLRMSKNDQFHGARVFRSWHERVKRSLTDDCNFFHGCFEKLNVLCLTI